MSDFLVARRKSSNSRLNQLRGRLGRAKEFAKSRACVYATGSFGRGEASQHSDLDLFIVGESKDDKPALRNLDLICLKAELIGATRAQKLPEFDGDGHWLERYTVQDLVTTLGKPEDDATNTFTARLLLLLESQPLIGADVYDESIKQAISKYWRDYEDRMGSFIPAFLANDILRLWRTFCINYEARTEKDPAVKKAKRKLKNYKLKHSRLLTCYSALAYMLAIHSDQGTVHPSDMVDMVSLSPTQRFERLRSLQFCGPAHESIDLVLEKYARFLEVTGRPSEALIEEFMSKDTARARYAEALELGDAVFQALRALAQINANPHFYRLLVV